MKQLALAMVLTAIVTPLALGLGAVLLVPIALVLVPAAVIAGLVALPALWLSSPRTTGARREPLAVVPDAISIAAPTAG